MRQATRHLVAPVAAIITVASVLAACSTTSDPATEQNPGSSAQGVHPPVVAVPPHGWVQAVKLNKPFTMGAEVIALRPGIESITITDVQLIEPTPGLHTIDSLVAAPTGDGLRMDFPVFPPPSSSGLTLEPAVGARVDANDGAPFSAQVLVGLKATATGRQHAAGLRVDYEHEGHDYSVDFAADMTYCVSRTGSESNC